jgi:uncharacterized membrane protein YgcG
MDTTVRRRTHSSAALRVLIAALLAAAIVLCGGTAAFATKPVPFNGAYVVDSVGVLGTRADEVKHAISELADSARLNLFVVYVDSFTGAQSRDDWADETANLNGFGVNDVLLAVATKDRLYQLSVDPKFPLSDDDLTQVEQVATVPSLRASDWAGAAINTASALGDVAAGRSVSAPIIAPTGSNDLSGQPGNGQTENNKQGSAVANQSTTDGLGGIIILAIVVIAVIVLVLSLRGRKKRKAAEIERDTTAKQAELEREVGRALVHVDDLITASEQELGFAAAQFGDASTAPFQASLDTAKAGLRESFGLKQQLDDSIPDTLQDRRTWSQRILELCAAAQQELTAHSEAFDRLRELEKNPQPAIDTMSAGLADIEPKGSEAVRAVDDLMARYAPSALTTVKDNPTHIAELVEFVSEKLAAIAALRAAGSTTGLVTAIQQGQSALAQATDMIGSIHALQQNLQTAAETLPGAIAAATADIAAGTELAGHRGTLTDSSELAAAIAILSRSRDLAAEHGAGNPIAAITDLTAASGRLDALLVAARESALNEARVREQLDRGIGAVQSEITAIKEFVVSRRAGIDVNARTALAESERYLALAITGRSHDQNQALNDLTAASQFAAQARAAATSDVTQYQNQYGSQGRPATSGASSDGNATTIAALAGILGGVLGSNLGNNGRAGRGTSTGSGWGGSAGWGGSSGRGSSSGGSSSRGTSARDSSSGGSSRGGGTRSGGRRGGGGRF